MLGVDKSHDTNQLTAPSSLCSRPTPGTTPQHLADPLEHLTPAELEDAPKSFEPRANLQAITLQQELEHLIGRFESAQLAAKASPQPSVLDSQKAVAQAKEIAKTLSQLIKQQNYTAAQQQWLLAQQLLWKHYPKDSRGVLHFPASMVGPNPAIARPYLNALSLAFFQTHTAN